MAGAVLIWHLSSVASSLPGHATNSLVSASIMCKEENEPSQSPRTYFNTNDFALGVFEAQKSTRNNGNQVLPVVYTFEVRDLMRRRTKVKNRPNCKLGIKGHKVRVANAGSSVGDCIGADCGREVHSPGERIELSEGDSKTASKDGHLVCDESRNQTLNLCLDFQGGDSMLIAEGGTPAGKI